MSDSIHFDGDPATDSARRHMEHVLKTGRPIRRWPWALAAAGSGGLWLLWRLVRGVARDREATENEPADGTR